MPKSKAIISDSESDNESNGSGSASGSGSSVEPSPPKKAKESSSKDKKDKKSSSGSKGRMTRDDENCPTWEISRTKLLKIRPFKGKNYVDIREYYEKNGKQLPGKKGVFLKLEEWDAICSVASEVTDQLTHM